ncbi:MAG: hypothetical protein OEY14_08550 [Myxococcales bacterium]|nr:hypothetical protein [Myxococcales bacterium]
MSRQPPFASRRPDWALALLGSSLLSLGCGAAGSEDAATEGVERVVAAVEVQLFAQAPLEQAEVRVRAGAIFARHRGIEGPQVLRLLGVGSGLELTECALLGAEPEEAPAEAALIELLDAGTVHLIVGGEAFELLPRSFPAMGSLVAGVVYAADRDALRFEDEARPISIEAEGSDALGRFEALSMPPEPVLSLHLDGRPAARWPIALRGEALALRWDASNPADALAIELRAGGQTLLCRSADLGAFDLPGELLGALPADPDARLRVSRERLEITEIAGVDAAWIRVAVTTEHRLLLR